METFVTYTFLLLVPILFFLYRRFINRKYKFPPGPKGWPILGNIFSISPETSHLDYTRLSKDYGDVTCFNMAGANIVMLNSGKAIREALVSEATRDAFAGRPDSFLTKHLPDYGPSISFMDFGDVWRLQRKFMVRTLKIFDGDQHTIHKTIQEELSVAVEMIKDTGEQPFYIKPVIVQSLANILFILMIGKRFGFSDPAMRAALDLDDISARILASQIINILTCFPFLRHLPFGYGKLYRKYQKALEECLHHFFEIPKKTFDPSVKRGFIDELFRLQADNPWLEDKNIKGIMIETIGAGLGTTRGTLLSFFLIILHKPHVMKKIQEEIDAVIGRDRSPDLSDREKMAYTEAASMETLRYLSVAPLGAPHKTTRDVRFRDYVLPKDTLVFANLWGAHHDEDFWGDPWEFRPERFLDENGQLLLVDSEIRKSWVPFGAGRRICLGAVFARSRVFLFITTLLQHFNFQPCADEPLPSCDPRSFQSGITLHAPKYKICAFLRR